MRHATQALCTDESAWTRRNVAGGEEYGCELDHWLTHEITCPAQGMASRARSSQRAGGAALNQAHEPLEDISLVTGNNDTDR